jgi:hypothetical protein
METLMQRKNSIKSKSKTKEGRRKKEKKESCNMPRRVFYLEPERPKNSSKNLMSSISTSMENS